MDAEAEADLEAEEEIYEAESRRAHRARKHHGRKNKKLHHKKRHHKKSKKHSHAPKQVVDAEAFSSDKVN